MGLLKIGRFTYCRNPSKVLTVTVVHIGSLVIGSSVVCVRVGMVDGEV